MTPLPDFSGPLTATVLAFRLAAGGPTPCAPSAIRVDARPVFTAPGQIAGTSSRLTVIAAGTPRPGAPPHQGEHGHEHPHVTGSRTVASTSGAVIDYVFIPDHTEYAKDGVSTSIIEQVRKLAGEWQLVYVPPRTQG